MKNIKSFDSFNEENLIPGVKENLDNANRTHIIPSTASIEEKARCYDEIANKISSFYDEENPDNKDVDLCTIGEYICSYFGYI